MIGTKSGLERQFRRPSGGEVGGSKTEPPSKLKPPALTSAMTGLSGNWFETKRFRLIPTPKRLFELQQSRLSCVK